MGYLSGNLLHVVPIGREVFLGRDVNGVTLAVIMSNSRRIPPNGHEVVAHAEDELVHCNALVLIAGLLTVRLHTAILRDMLLVFILVDMGHGCLVDIKKHIDIIPWIGLVTRLVCLRQLFEVRTADSLIRILLADILANVFPCEWNALLTLSDSFPTAFRIVEQDVAVGSVIAHIAVDGHDEGVDGTHT